MAFVRRPRCAGTCGRLRRRREHTRGTCEQDDPGSVTTTRRTQLAQERRSPTVATQRSGRIRPEECPKNRGRYTISNEVLGLGLQHVEVEAELNQRDLMMIGRMRTHREGEAMAIHNRQDFHPLATLREAHCVAPALRRGKRRIDEALALVDALRRRAGYSPTG
jgi:hypothetical protein